MTELVFTFTGPADRWVLHKLSEACETFKRGVLPGEPRFTPSCGVPACPYGDPISDGVSRGQLREGGLVCVCVCLGGNLEWDGEGSQGHQPSGPLIKAQLGPQSTCFHYSALLCVSVGL